MDPLIEGLFKQFRKSQELESVKESDAFELFVATLLLRDEILEQREVSDLLLDDSTLGVDIALLEVNGQLVDRPEDLPAVCDKPWVLEVSLHLLQIKMSSSVSSSEILNFGDTAKKVLNNVVPSAHEKLASIAATLKAIFDAYATKLRSQPAVTLSFATTAGEVSLKDPTVLDRLNTVRTDLEKFSFVGALSVQLVGALGLLESSKRKHQANEVGLVLEKSINLPEMPEVTQAILGIVSLKEMLKLIQNSDGSLDDKIFYDNVRGFKGEDNDVNKQISATLGSDGRALLPVLNNGVTVVARSYTPKPGDAVTLTGYQIVNGCQTSHCIYYAASAIGDASASVFLPMKLVVTESDEVATKIIRATNSQTAVSDSDLVALTKFQRRLEEFYELDALGANLIYERRSGQYYFKSVTNTRVVTISEQMRAVAAVFLDKPHIAARYPQHLFGAVGDDIFDEQHQLAPYVAAAFLAYRLETAFRTRVLESKYKPIRYHILMAYKYDLYQGRSAALNSSAITTQSQKMVDSIKGSDYITLFRAIGDRIIAAAGGNLPSADRIKRQPFTDSVRTEFVRN